MFYFLSFVLLSLFSYRWLFLSPFPALVRNFPSCNVFPQSPTDDYISPFILPPTSTLLAGTTPLRIYHCPHSFLYKPCIRVPEFFFDSLLLERGLIGCPKSSVRNYQYSLHNNPNGLCNLGPNENSIYSLVRFMHDFVHFSFMFIVIFYSVTLFCQSNKIHSTMPWLLTLPKIHTQLLPSALI